MKPLLAPRTAWRTAQWATLVVATGLIACRWLPSGIGDDSESTETASDDGAPEAAEPQSDEPAEPRPGYVDVTVGGVAMTDEGNVVFLLDEDRQNAVPIFIGPAEAFSIQLRLDERRFRRPLTHDLFDAAVDRLGGRILNVRIDQIKSSTFHATLVLSRDGELHELDARSSDAIALALGNGAPIRMAETVIRKSGVDVARLESLARSHDMPFEPPEPEREPIKL